MAPNRKDGKQCARYGAWFREGHTLNFSAPLEGSIHTNNRVELMAAIEVFRLVAKTTDTQLCVDSQLVTGPRYGWKDGTGKDGKRNKGDRSKTWAYGSNCMNAGKRSFRIRPGPTNHEPQTPSLWKRRMMNR